MTELLAVGYAKLVTLVKFKFAVLVEFKATVLVGRMKEEVVFFIAVVFTTAVAFVVILVLATGSKQALYKLSHMLVRVSSPLLRQVSSTVAQVFLH
jgi:hypothetical protein